jgi:polysaccharide export outer membrane protein
MLKSFWIVLLMASSLVLGCAPTGPYVWASKVPLSTSTESVVRPGDKLQIVVSGQEAMSGEFEVRPGGEFVLPVAGRFRTTGLTANALAAELQKRLAGILAKPYVTVVIASRKPATVSVLGEVRTPGRFELREREGVLEALARAGGLTPFADEDAVFVIRRGQSPRVRFKYSDLAAGAPASLNYELLDGDIVVVE